MISTEDILLHVIHKEEGNVFQHTLNGYFRNNVVNDSGKSVIQSLFNIFSQR